MTADYPDWGSEQATATAIGSTSLTGTGLAIDPTHGGTIATDANTTAVVGATHAAGKTIAGEISVTGAPLVHNNTALITDNFTFTGVGTTHTTATTAIGQICYELFLSLENALPAGSASYVQVTMDWFDQGTGLQLARRRFKLVSGVNGTPHRLKIAGPVHGNQVRVQYLLVADSVNLVTVNSTLFGTSRLYQRDVMRTTLFGTDGFQQSGVIPEANVLANMAPLVGAGGQQPRIMAPYSGLVHCMGFTSSGAADMVVAILEAFTANPLLVNSQVVAELVTNAQGFFDQFVALPNVQCIAQLNNRNAAQQTLSFVAAIQEPAN